MQKQEIYFDKIKVGSLVLLYTLGVLISINLFYPMLSILSSDSNRNGIILSIIFIVIGIIFLGIFLYLLIPQVKKFFYKEAVIIIDEKGVAISHFYEVFIPWEAINKATVVLETQIRRHLIISVKDNDKYLNEHIQGISYDKKKANIKKYLSPFVMYSYTFNTADEIIASLINDNVANYKEKVASI